MTPYWYSTLSSMQDKDTGNKPTATLMQNRDRGKLRKVSVLTEVLHTLAALLAN